MAKYYLSEPIEDTGEPEFLLYLTDGQGDGVELRAKQIRGARVREEPEGGWYILTINTGQTIRLYSGLPEELGILLTPNGTGMVEEI